MAVVALVSVIGLIAWYEAPRLVRLRLWGELILMAALLGIGAVLWLVQAGGRNLAFVTYWLYAVFAPVTRFLINLLP